MKKMMMGDEAQGGSVFALMPRSLSGPIPIYRREAILRTNPTLIMPQGSKTSYTSKQKRQAEHIEKSY